MLVQGLAPHGMLEHGKLHFIPMLEAKVLGQLLLALESFTA